MDETPISSTTPVTAEKVLAVAPNDREALATAIAKLPEVATVESRDDRDGVAELLALPHPSAALLGPLHPVPVADLKDWLIDIGERNPAKIDALILLSYILQNLSSWWRGS